LLFKKIFYYKVEQLWFQNTFDYDHEE
jgi:hypothetical protein